MRAEQRRDKLYNVRLNEEEDLRFKRLARHHNLDVSQLVRMFDRGGLASLGLAWTTPWSRACGGSGRGASTRCLS